MKIKTRFTRKKIASCGKTHMEIRLEPPKEPVDKGPVCVVLAIDMSEGMGQAEEVYGFTEMYTPIISRVKSAAYTVIDELGDDDLFGCAVFNGEGFVCQELIHPVSRMVPDIKLQIWRIEPRGGRNIEEGLKQAERLITERVAAGYRCRVILVTCGETESIQGGDEGLADICADLRKRGVTVSPVGCGNGYGMDSLARISHASGGLAHHVQNYDRLEDIFRDEIEALRNESARDVELTIRCGDSLEIGQNLNGYRQKNEVGMSKISIGNLHEPVSLYFEIASKAEKAESAEMEISALYKEAYKIVSKKMEFHCLEILDEKEKTPSLPHDIKVLASYLGAFTAKTIKVASSEFDKLMLDRLEASLEKAKAEIEAMKSEYPSSAKLLEKCRLLIEDKGRIFFEGRLGSGENMAVYFELSEILRRSSKKTIKNMYI